ncbi:hypothetical protein LQL77_31190 [Rhodococcus cerastii]|nr:hypothetical protein [Rhodococcus cerastii]
MPRRYPPEFRRKALDLSKSGRTSRRRFDSDLNTTEQSIDNWRHQELIDTAEPA